MVDKESNQLVIGDRVVFAVKARYRGGQTVERGVILGFTLKRVRIDVVGKQYVDLINPDCILKADALW